MPLQGAYSEVALLLFLLLGIPFEIALDPVIKSPYARELFFLGIVGRDPCAQAAPAIGKACPYRQKVLKCPKNRCNFRLLRRPRVYRNSAFPARAHIQKRDKNRETEKWPFGILHFCAFMASEGAFSVLGCFFSLA